MNETRMYEALGFVFRYLRDNDLASAANVCRAWVDIAMYEDISRECFTFIVDDLKQNYQLYCTFNNKVQINQGNCIPTLQIFFTKDKKSPYVDGYLCKNTKFNSYTVLMKSNSDEDLFEKVNSCVSFSFLAEFSAEVKMYTYILPNIRKNMFGSKLRYIYGSDIKPSGLINESKVLPNIRKNMFDSKLCYIYGSDIKPSGLINESKVLLQKKNAKVSSNILFILCQESGYYHLVSWFNNLIDGSSFNDTIAWGGTVSELSVCRFTMLKHYCKLESEFVFIFMKSPKMKAYIECLPIECYGIKNINSRLEDFRDRVQLSYDSIAFLHVSTSYVPNYVSTVFRSFRQIFPNIKLFRFYGSNSFGGYGLEDTYRNMIQAKGINIGIVASIMILTFE